MRTMLTAALAAIVLTGCAGTTTTLEQRCAIYQRTIDAMYLRLEDPVYIQDEDRVALAKRAILDAELAMAIAGCPPAEF